MSKGKDKNLVAVFGCGYWGKNLVRNFHELGALRAIADPNEKTAHAMAKQYGAAAETTQQILSDPSVSGIVIAAPAELHFELAFQALHAGKHVFVEKPLALQVEQAEQLVRIAEAGQRSLMVGHLLQYHPAFLRLKDLVHAGELGRI
ncbi:MAG: Gfo/Idh/MocA family oxidoreductase, partial [SAR324 cluster bacterium]|nr:Gfo/Idh/MocA family oxidoreductase [SAR324 cluster bacterium]